MQREELLSVNREAWNHQVARGNRWTIPVDPSAIELARGGRPEIVLTPVRKVPQSWFPNLENCKTLMLASGGGQQAPVMAAAGADVTVVDLSDKQLEQDQLVASREGLRLKTVRASMDDLSEFESRSFDLVIHPCSNSFVPDLKPVWSEVARVIRVGGWLMAGFCNPLIFLFDYEKLTDGHLEIKHRLPYSDLTSLSAEDRKGLLDRQEPLVFGHTLTEQMGEQLEAGFAMHKMYEDVWGPDAGDDGYHLLDGFTASFLATLSQRIAD